MSELRPLCAATSTAGGGFVWHLPHGPEAAGTARQLVHAALGVWGTAQEGVDDVLVVVSELVTNALVHALPPVILRLRRASPDGTVRVEVTDGGPVPEGRSWRPVWPSDEHGRGTHIVASLAAEHGILVEPGSDTIVRWAHLRPCA